MSIFNGQRLLPEQLQLDVDRIRDGWYSDAYFLNTIKILTALAKEGYTFSGTSNLETVDVSKVECGDVVVEMQFFTRRKPLSLVAGVDEALAILQAGTGYFDNGEFINTYSQLEVEAVQDGTFAYYDGEPLSVQPVLKIRGRYRDFSHLETPILGVLTEATRVATNAYQVVEAAGGKDVLFFPARFAHYKLQALHGYAYSLAVNAYNLICTKESRVIVSTDSQGSYWGGAGGGTISHATIACFLGDSVETMMQFARIIPVEVPRIALVDYHNDCVGTTLSIMKTMFETYWELCTTGKTEEMQKYKLYAVRADTSGNMRDISVEPLGVKEMDCGVNPRLIWKLRTAMDSAYKDWKLPSSAEKEAREWCKAVKIVVTGGFDVGRIRSFEDLGVPVDIYGVGSSFLENNRQTGTNNDYTADIVRIKIGEAWYPMSKAGRQACDNPKLELVNSPDFCQR